MMNPRQVFSRVGFAYAAYLTISTASQLLAAALLQPFRARMGEDLWFVVCMLCMYPAAFLVFWLLMRRIPKDPAGRPDMPLRAGRFLGIFIICVGVMYAGNLLGQLISQMADQLTGRQSVNAVVELVMGMDTWAVFLAAVAAAPVMEELLFRKLLLDRVSVFGDRTAILLSGVVFGLAHGNFYQFFYAFGLGSIFAWVYLRTRRIRFSILLHVMINFCGSILPMQLLHMMRDYPVIGAHLLLGQTMLMMAAAICGVILLICQRRDWILLPGSCPIPAGKWFGTVFANKGILVFFLVSLLFFFMA